MSRVKVLEESKRFDRDICRKHVNSLVTPLFFAITWRYLRPHQWERFHQSTRL